MEAAQAPVEDTGIGESAENAIRAEWLTELRRRIEASKYYPRMARSSHMTGMVLLQVEITAAAEIGAVNVLHNTGSQLLADGALAIQRQAAEQPLGSQPLPNGFIVEVPIHYELRK